MVVLEELHRYTAQVREPVTKTTTTHSLICKSEESHCWIKAIWDFVCSLSHAMQGTQHVGEVGLKRRPRWLFWLTCIALCVEEKNNTADDSECVLPILKQGGGSFTLWSCSSPVVAGMRIWFKLKRAILVEIMFANDFKKDQLESNGSNR